MYKNILFDLDGTLTDPSVGITNSVAYALSKLGIDVPAKSELLKFIGPPLQDSFARLYGMDEDSCTWAVELYREYFREKGIYENEVYPAIKELLIKLKATGKKVIVATSKPEEFAVTILRYFELYEYFDFVAGATMDGARRKKGDVIAYALKMCGISDVEQTVMVGDKRQDISGANEHGIDSIGVLYGYGDREELSGATYIARDASDVYRYIEG